MKQNTAQLLEVAVYHLPASNDVVTILATSKYRSIHLSGKM